MHSGQLRSHHVRTPDQAQEFVALSVTDDTRCVCVRDDYCHVHVHSDCDCDSATRLDPATNTQGHSIWHNTTYEA